MIISPVKTGGYNTILPYGAYPGYPADPTHKTSSVR